MFCWLSKMCTDFSKWVIAHDTFVRKQLYLSSSCVLFWMVKHVFTLPAMFTGKGRYCGLVLVSDNTILYLCFYKVKHFVNIDESYFWAAWIFANLSPADSLNHSLTTWSMLQVHMCLNVYMWTLLKISTFSSFTYI